MWQRGSESLRCRTTEYDAALRSASASHRTRRADRRLVVMVTDCARPATRSVRVPRSTLAKRYSRLDKAAGQRSPGRQRIETLKAGASQCTPRGGCVQRSNACLVRGVKLCSALCISQHPTAGTPLAPSCRPSGWPHPHLRALELRLSLRSQKGRCRLQRRVSHSFHRSRSRRRTRPRHQTGDSSQRLRRRLPRLEQCRRGRCGQSTQSTASTSARRRARVALVSW